MFTIIGVKLFQFTPLREGRRSTITAQPILLLFQFTPLREGRRHFLMITTTSHLFQFTPLREGRHRGPLKI